MGQSLFSIFLKLLILYLDGLIIVAPEAEFTEVVAMVLSDVLQHKESGRSLVSAS